MHAGHITLAAYGLGSQSCQLSRVSFIGLTCCLATADITRAFLLVCVPFERLLICFFIFIFYYGLGRWVGEGGGGLLNHSHPPFFSFTSALIFGTHIC